MWMLIAKGNGEGVSLSTFALWAALAWITCFTLLKQNINPSIIVIYGIGATGTMIILLYKGRYGWSGFDTMIAGLTILCIILWLTNGAKAALLLSVAAGAIASFPFIALTWQHPEKSLIIPNTAFLVANTLCFFAAKKWTLEDRLFPAVNIVVCSLLVIPRLIM